MYAIFTLLSHSISGINWMLALAVDNPVDNIYITLVASLQESFLLLLELCLVALPNLIQ